MVMSRLGRSAFQLTVRGVRPVAVAVCVIAGVLGVPAASGAEVSTFGSSLSVPATLDTAENLNYEGTGIALPGSVFHIPHDGADTALWDVAIPALSASAPSAGQVVTVSLEGCARQPSGAPAPLTQIHFQVLSPLPGGGAQVSLTSQPFDIPVCGAAGASGSTVTSYAPINLCVAQGNYVGFNDEGGFVGGAPPQYPAGVPYQVIGAVQGASMDSFIRGGGTNNGSTMAASDRTNHDGFATNNNEELMLQSTLATGADALPVCGGTKGVPAPGSAGYSQSPAGPALRVGKQTDGINHHGIASIAMFCHAGSVCAGSLTLSPLTGHGRARSVHQSFSIAGGKTTHVSVRVPKSVVALARKHRKGVPMRLTALIAGRAVVQTIQLRIF
ncbi:MAG: hypothetical protein JWM60_1054 [Solirubrobacterales bacterium]|nr:hypothetical protein [Solirubrobacterales bacterium]